ncbi:MAG: nucleoside 2-deoxyribosyltransferase [Syntrophaceae bacterium]
MKKNKPMLYLAGPLFTEAERSFNETLRDVLSEFFDVFLPQEAGLIGEMMKHGIGPSDSSHRIYEACMKALRKCDVVLIVLDGVMVDDGSAFELGIAHMRKIPRFGYLSDDRKKPEPPSVNPMIYFSLDRIFTDLKGLAEWAEGSAEGLKRQ